MRTSVLWVLGLSLFCVIALSKTKDTETPSPIEIHLTGLKGEALKNTEKRLKEQKKLLHGESSVPIIMHFYAEIPNEIKAAIKPYGYFKPTIYPSITRKGKMWHASFRIEPGTRLRFTTVDIKISGPGKHNHEFEKALEKFPVKQGDYFSSPNYEKAKDKLVDIASDYGYFEAKYTISNITVNLNNNTTKVVMHFQTGPRYSFGKTVFSKSPFRTSFLNKFLRYKEGQPYEDKKVEKSHRKLSKTDYFQQVVMVPQVSKAKNRRVPMKILLYPQSQIRYTFGAGYGSNTGPRGLISADFHWINSYGHSLKFLLRGAQSNSQLAINYIIPGPDPTQDRFVITTGIANIKQITGEGNNFQTSVRYQTKVYKWNLTVALNYLTERYRLQNLPRTDADALYPRIILERFYTHPTLFAPKYGYKIMLTAAAASQNVGSKNSFLQGEIVAKGLVSIFDRRTRFIAHGSVGKTKIDNIENLPLSLQLFAGGALSVRGYEFNGIGPGKEKVVLSFEVQQRIWKDLYIAGFIDTGQVDNNFHWGDMNIGVGPALVYDSPIGTLELSVAQAITQHNKPWMVQFSMGPLI